MSWLIDQKVFITSIGNLYALQRLTGNSSNKNPDSALWLYGFMALWLYGFMALWLYGFMALWLAGLRAKQPVNLIATYFKGSFSQFLS